MKKPEPLEPPDPTRCQVEKKLGAFQLGGNPRERTRCTAVPDVIATETIPDQHGRRGSMSMCRKHQEIFVKQMGARAATFEEIKR